MINKVKTKNSAFSLVEIMFVIWIIAFLSVSGVNYFNNFVDTKRLDTEIFLINNNLESLNSKIKNKEVYDYEVNFSWSKDYLSYKLNQTIKKLDTKLVIDKNTKNYTMSSNFTNTWAWNIKIYSNNKKTFEKLLNQKDSFTWKIDLYQNYDIKSYFETGEDLFWIFYYSEDNLSNSWVTTNFIEAKNDKTGLTSKDFLLKNINSKLSFYSWNTLWDTKDVYLFFEKAWLEKSIKISK